MKHLFLIILGIIGLALISGCVTEQNEGTMISLKNLSTDKALYHSSENVNLVPIATDQLRFYFLSAPRNIRNTMAFSLYELECNCFLLLEG